MDEWEVFPREAVACALKSIEQGVARVKPSRQELFERASAIIRNARESTELLMKHGLIKQPPSEAELLKIINLKTANKWFKITYKKKRKLERRYFYYISFLKPSYCIEAFVFFLAGDI